MPKRINKEKYTKELKDFGQHLRTVRTRNGYTLEELADKSELAYDTLSDIENGKIACTITTVFAIAKALKVQPATLFLNN